MVRSRSGEQLRGLIATCSVDEHRGHYDHVACGEGKPFAKLGAPGSEPARRCGIGGWKGQAHIPNVSSCLVCHARDSWICLHALGQRLMRPFGLDSALSPACSHLSITPRVRARLGVDRGRNVASGSISRRTRRVLPGIGGSLHDQLRPRPLRLPRLRTAAAISLHEPAMPMLLVIVIAYGNAPLSRSAAISSSRATDRRRTSAAGYAGLIPSNGPASGDFRQGQGRAIDVETCSWRPESFVCGVGHSCFPRNKSGLLNGFSCLRPGALSPVVAVEAGRGYRRALRRSAAHHAPRTTSGCGNGR